MNLAVLAQAARWGFGDWAIALVIIVGVVAVVWAAIKAMGITIPDWLAKILMILAVVIVAVLAIKILLSL